MLRIIVHAKTKWLEVSPVSSTSPIQQWTHNAIAMPIFSFWHSKKTGQWKWTWVQQYRSWIFFRRSIIRFKKAPYHQCCNGLVARAVWTVQTVLNIVTGGTFTKRLPRFFLNFQINPICISRCVSRRCNIGRPITNTVGPDSRCCKPNIWEEGDPLRQIYRRHSSLYLFIWSWLTMGCQ